MTSSKQIEFDIIKDEDYGPTSQNEIISITELLKKEILEIANRFDGSCDVKLFIKIVVKGNA